MGDIRAAIVTDVHVFVSLSWARIEAINSIACLTVAGGKGLADVSLVREFKATI